MRFLWKCVFTSGWMLSASKTEIYLNTQKEKFDCLELWHTMRCKKYIGYITLKIFHYRNKCACKIEWDCHLRSKQWTLCKVTCARHGRSQDFFSGGETLFQKNFQKIRKKIQKIFKKNSKNFQKILKNIQKNVKKFSKKISKKNWKILKNFIKKFPKNALFSRAPAGFFRGEVRSTRGGLVRGVAAWGVPGGGAPRTPEKFSKNL